MRVQTVFLSVLAGIAVMLCLSSLARSSAEGYPCPYEKTVFDFGMNKGGDTAFYLSKGLCVVAIEASPVLCRRGASLFREWIEKKQLRIVNAAITARDGDNLTFFTNPRVSEKSGFDMYGCCFGKPKHQNCTTALCRSDTVRSRTCASLLREYSPSGRPHYVKIDIQGFDNVCLDSLLANPDLLPQFMSSEGVGSLSLLHRLGYEWFKFQDNANIQKQSPAFDASPPDEWQKLSVRPLQWSGPFGNEAWDLDRGLVWRNYAQADTDASQYKDKWLDTHACLFDCYQGVRLQ